MKKYLLATIAFTLIGATSPSRWKVETKSDPMTDAKSVSLSLASNPDMLLIQCHTSGSDRISVTVGTIRSYTGGRPVVRSTLVRFDNGAPTPQQWVYLDSGAVAQEGQGAFVRFMALSQRVVVRLTDRRGAPVDVGFDLVGSSVQVARFRSACAAIGVEIN